MGASFEGLMLFFFPSGAAPEMTEETLHRSYSEQKTSLLLRATVGPYAEIFHKFNF